MQLRYEDVPGAVQIDGVRYKLKNIHWHSPSEHTINGQRFAVEQHMVHKSDEGNITVVAILYRLGRPEPFLMQVYCHYCAVSILRFIHEGVIYNISICSLCIRI